MLGIGAVEFLILLFPFFFGSGLPTGMPPGPDDPVLMALASAEQVGFAYWPGMAKVDGNANPTEKFLGQPELSQFAQRARATLLKEMKSSLAESHPESMESMSAIVDEIAWGPLTRPTFLVLTEVDLKGESGSAKIGVALVNQLGDSANGIAKHFSAWSAASQREFADSVSSESGVDFVELRLPGQTPSIFVSVREGYLLVGTDRKWMANANLKNSATPTKKNVVLEKLETELSVERRSSVAYLDLGKIRGMQADPNVAQFDLSMNYLFKQLKNVQAIAFVTGLDSRGFLTRAKFDVKAGETILDLLPSTPLSAELLDALPMDATGAIALRLSPKQFLDDLKVQVEAATGEGKAFEQMLENSNDFMGVRLRDDLLEVMDDFAFFYSRFQMANPTKGWLLGVRLRDEMSFQDMLNRINVRVGQFMQNNGMAFREVANNGITIHSIEMNDFGMPTSFSYALVEKYLVFSLDPATIGNFARNLRGEKNFSRKPAVEALFADCERLKLARPTMVAELDVAAIAKLVIPFFMQFMGDQPMTPNGELKFSDLPTVEVLTKNVEPNLSALFKTETGFQILHRQTYPGTSPLCFAGTAFALSLPIFVAGEQQGAAVQSQNNMRQIIIAAHNYHQSYQKLPNSYSVDKNGKPLLSWRVKILPFVEQQNLYEQFHLDEPWNSEHNLKLAAKMPDVFKHPRLKLAEGKTVYLGVTGKNGVLIAPKGNAKTESGRDFAEIVDGTSNTVMIVEVAEKNAVTWTAPDDFDFEQIPGKLSDELGHYWGSDKTSIVGMSDGAVHFLKPGSKDQDVRALMTCSGGEVLDIYQLFSGR